MKVLDLLKGKKVTVMTDARMPVTLEIKEVKENSHSQELEPSTAANDWWPATRDWTTYTVYFTNGASKEYESLNSIEFSEND